MYNYDEDIALLTRHPDRITDKWTACTGLFKCIPNEKVGRYPTGCLTQVKKSGGRVNSLMPGLVEEILQDDNIPSCSKDIKIEHLEHFKRYQERADEYCRENKLKRNDVGLIKY